MKFTEGPKDTWTGFVTTKDRQSIRITVHKSIIRDDALTRAFLGQG